MLAPADTPSSVVAALPSDLLLLVAAAAAVLAWTALRRRGVRSGSKRLFSATRNGVSVTTTFKLPSGTIGPDSVHFDDETKAKLAAAGLDPGEVEHRLANVEPGDRSARTVLDMSLERGPFDEAAREQVRKQLDEQLDKLGIDHTEVDARLEQGDDHVHIEHVGPAAHLPDLGEPKPGEVKTVVNIDVEGDAMDPRSRAKLDEELDRLGIDRSEIDEKLDRGQTHIHVEHDLPPQT